MMNKHKIRFQLDSLEGCCGAFVLSGFEQPKTEMDYSNYWNGRQINLPPLESEAAVFEEFEQQIIRELQEVFYDPWGDNKNAGTGSQIGYITLVTRNQNRDDGGQFPELLSYLLFSGWRIDRQWKNANTGNSIAQLSKEYTIKDVPRLDNDDED